MQRIDTATKATDLFGAGKHGFKDGNQGLGIVPTDLSASWFNEVQEEIANVIEAAAMALNAADRTQLLQAIKKLTVEEGSTTVWYQAAAPTGWTQITTHDNKALRVVGGPGGGTGGTVAFTTAFASKGVSGTVGDTTLTGGQIPPHTHPIGTYNDETGAGKVSTAAGTFQSNVDSLTNTGGGGSHNHSFVGTAINLAVQYIDMIMAGKD